MHWAQSFLRKSGYDVLGLSAVTPESLIEHATQADIIILDLAMPGMDGFQVLDALRHEPSTEAVPVLMLTAHDPVSLRLKGLSIGADDYMVKPPNKQELLLRIGAILRRSGFGESVPKRIKVRSASARVALIDPATVAYLEAENNFCWAYTNEGRLMTYQRMSELADLLKPTFLQVHRSYAVNLSRVTAYDRTSRTSTIVRVDIADSPAIPVAAPHREELREALGL